MNRKSGASPSGISVVGIAHCQPMIQRRPIGVVQTVSGDMQPCDDAEVVQIAQRRADLAHDAQHGGDVVRAHAAQPRADRFAGDPATEISRTATALRERRPVVVRRRHRRMIAMREMPRFRLEPRVVRRIRRAHERQRAVERVDDFLIVAMLACAALRRPNSIRAEAASRADARGSSWVTLYIAGASRIASSRDTACGQHASHLRFGQNLLGGRRELRHERDVRQHGDLDVLHATAASRPAGCRRGERRDVHGHRTRRATSCSAAIFSPVSSIVSS